MTQEHKQIHTQYIKNTTRVKQTSCKTTARLEMAQRTMQHSLMGKVLLYSNDFNTSRVISTQSSGGSNISYVNEIHDMKKLMMEHDKVPIEPWHVISNNVAF